MDRNRRKQIDALFDRMLDLEPSRRAEALTASCVGDDELRREVELLLHKAGQADKINLQSVINSAIGRVVKQSSVLKPGQKIGHYTVKSQIGRGGMGQVWLARDERLERDVAIKILPPEFAYDAERVNRFKLEAYAVGRLNHSNIVTIHDTDKIAGSGGELHFIVTEFIEGKTLRTLMAESNLIWRGAVMIAAQVASALNAAHSVKIIHRDIKPENIMVLADKHVKVLDFGIAKLTELRNADSRLRNEEIENVAVESASDNPQSAIRNPQLTVSGTLIGTTRYMSPEQVRGEELDARTDIFSFGIVLYEMVAGRHPYADKADQEIIAELKSDDEIPPVSSIKADIPAALNNLIGRAICKRREDRYANVAEMQIDIEHLKSLIRLSNEKREKRRLREQNADQLLTQYVVFHETDSTTCIPLGTLTGILWFASLKRGKLERRLIRKSLFSGLMKNGWIVLPFVVLTMLAAAWLSVTETWAEQVMRDGHTAAVRRAVFSPDGTKLVSVGEDKQVIVWDFAKRGRLATFTDHTDWVTSVAFSPDGKWFATASYDKTVIVWDAVNLKKEAVLRGHRYKVLNVAFSPDGKTLVSAAGQPDPPDEATLLWRVGSWERFAQIPVTGTEAGSLLFPGGSNRMIYHHDSTNIWNVTTGRPLGNQFDPGWGGNNAAISPDGALLVSVTGPGEVIFADFRAKRVLDKFKAHQDNGRAVAFSPDGKLVATGAENIILWDAATRQRITTIDYPSIVWSAAFSSDGRWLVTTHGDGGIRVWDVEERHHAVGFNEHNGSVRAVAWSRDGKRFASAGEDRSVMVWNADSGHREMLFAGHPTRVAAVAFAPDGNTLASVDRDGRVIVWDIAQRRERLGFDHSITNSGNCLVFSPDGRMLATSHGVYESATGRQLTSFNCPGHWLSSSGIYGLAFSTDGIRLTMANSYGCPVVLDTATWKLIEKANFSPRSFVSIGITVDGKQLVTGEDGGAVQLWTASPLQPTAALGQHKARVKSVAFSPDGSEVVSAGDDKTIALWNVSSRKQITTIGLHTAPVYAVAFSPDGKQIVSGGHDHSVRLYTRHRSLLGRPWE